MLRTALRLLAAGILATGLLATATPAAVAAESKVELPFKTFGDIVATNTRIFISGGGTSTSIVVARPTGSIIGEIRNLPGPADLQLSADRSLLYVALNGAIAVFDTQSLRERARYQTDTCNRHLALSKDYLWFSYGCRDSEIEANVGAIDLRRSFPPRLGLIERDNHRAYLLAVAASNGEQWLLTGEPGTSPASLRAYAMGADGGLTFRAKTDYIDVMWSDVDDLAVSRDGASVFTASGYPYAILEWTMADLTKPKRQLPTVAYPNSVELSSDGRRIAAGSAAWYDPDIYIFDLDGTRAEPIELGDDLLQRGLAWSPTGRRLYAVTGEPVAPERPAVLHVLNAPR